MNGKGDTPRPFSVSPQEYGKNWNRTFAGKDFCDSCKQIVTVTQKEACTFCNGDRHGQDGV